MKKDLAENIRIVEETYDEIADFFSPLMSSGEVSRKEIDAVDKFLTYIHPNGKIADLGCGLGKHGRYCAMKNYQVTGYDISTSMITKAKAFNNKKGMPRMAFLHIANMCDFQSDEHYDGVISCYSFVHLTYEQSAWALEYIKRYLNKGAVIMLTVYKGDRDGLYPEELKPSCFMYFRDYFEDEFKKLITEAGYTILDVLIWSDTDEITASNSSMDSLVIGIIARF